MSIDHRVGYDSLLRKHILTGIESKCCEGIMPLSWIAIAITNMRNAIDAVKKWMVSVKLKLNDAKSEFIIIGTLRQQLAKIYVDNLR